MALGVLNPNSTKQEIKAIRLMIISYAAASFTKLPPQGFICLHVAILLATSNVPVCTTEILRRLVAGYPWHPLAASMQLTPGNAVRNFASHPDEMVCGTH
jgi:hypothetical protein